MSLANEYTDNFFIGESSFLDAHLRLLFRAYHYETPCTSLHINFHILTGHVVLSSHDATNALTRDYIYIF